MRKPVRSDQQFLGRLGKSSLRPIYAPRLVASTANGCGYHGDSWANSQFVGKPERSVPVRTPSRKWSFIPKTQLASLRLLESRVRKTCTHGLGGGRWPASGQPDAPPPTRQKWCPHFGVAGHGVRRPFASSFKESYNALTRTRLQMRARDFMYLKHKV